MYKAINSMRKITDNMPKSPLEVHAAPDFLSLQTLVIACSYLKMDQIMRLWIWIRDTGIDPCWFKDCNKALCRFFSHIASPVYIQINPYSNLASRYSQLKYALVSSWHVDPNVIMSNRRISLPISRSYCKCLRNPFNSLERISPRNLSFIPFLFVFSRIMLQPYDSTQGFIHSIRMHWRQILCMLPSS